MKRLLTFSLPVTLLVLALYMLSVHFAMKALFPEKIEEDLMGTRVVIWVKETGGFRNAQKTLAYMRGIEKHLNRFSADSDIARINLAEGKPVHVSEDTIECVKLAKKAARLSRGAFDPTLSDHRKIYIDEKRKIIRLNSQKLELNLDGIGKGFAVQKGIEFLFKMGVKNAMIDLKSSLAVLGGPWKIGIQHPRKKNEVLLAFELLSGEAVSTSGDYEQGPHIKDPRTGLPAKKCQAVTLIGKDAGLLDALSTAVYVLGPREGLNMIKRIGGIKAVIVAADGKVIKHGL